MIEAAGRDKLRRHDHRRLPAVTPSGSRSSRLPNYPIILDARDDDARAARAAQGYGAQLVLTPAPTAQARSPKPKRSATAIRPSTSLRWFEIRQPRCIAATARNLARHRRQSRRLHRRRGYRLCSDRRRPGAQGAQAGVTIKRSGPTHSLVLSGGKPGLLAARFCGRLRSRNPRHKVYSSDHGVVRQHDRHLAASRAPEGLLVGIVGREHLGGAASRGAAGFAGKTIVTIGADTVSATSRPALRNRESGRRGRTRLSTERGTPVTDLTGVPLVDMLRGDAVRVDARHRRVRVRRHRQRVAGIRNVDVPVFFRSSAEFIARRSACGVASASAQPELALMCASHYASRCTARRPRRFCESAQR